MSERRYCVVLLSYDGQTMNQLVFEGDKPWTGTEDEAMIRKDEYSRRNPKGFYITKQYEEETPAHVPSVWERLRQV